MKHKYNYAATGSAWGPSPAFVAWLDSFTARAERLSRFD